MLSELLLERTGRSTRQPFEIRRGLTLLPCREHVAQIKALERAHCRQIADQVTAAIAEVAQQAEEAAVSAAELEHQLNSREVEIGRLEQPHEVIAVLHEQRTRERIVRAQQRLSDRRLGQRFLNVS